MTMQGPEEPRDTPEPLTPNDRTLSASESRSDSTTDNPQHERPNTPEKPGKPGKLGRGRPRGRQQTNPITREDLTAAGLPLTEPHQWLTQDWRTRRAVRLHRLGEWAALTRARLQLTSRDLEQLALQDGEPASSTLFLRVEWLRRTDQSSPAEERERISLTAIDWLATLAGQTLSDVDRYMRGGDLSALEPDEAGRAEAIRSAYLSLSPSRRQSLEDFARHLYHLDELDQRAHVFPARTKITGGAETPGATATGQERSEALSALNASDALVVARAAEDEVRSTQAALEQARARVRDLEAAMQTEQQTGQTEQPQRQQGQQGGAPGGGDQDDPPGQFAFRRRQRRLEPNPDHLDEQVGDIWRRRGRGTDQPGQSDLPGQRRPSGG